MKRSQITAGRFFLLSGRDDKGFPRGYLMHITAVSGDRAEVYNVTRQAPADPMTFPDLLTDDSEAVSEDLAKRIWWACLTFTSESIVQYGSFMIDSYGRGSLEGNDGL